MFEPKLKYDPIANAYIFNVMRTLQGINPGDTWRENYLGHAQKRGTTFVDTYHVMLQIGSEVNPKTILEIGCRSGISICQLLSSCKDFEGKKVYLFDVFNDGFISPEIVKMNLKYLNISTEIVEFRIGDSRETIPKFKVDNPDLKFDYVLVDGDHNKPTAKIDLDNVTDMLNQEGILIFDDIAPDGCDLNDVWQLWKSENQDKFKFFENYDGKGVGIAIKL